jgi:glucose/arabinose dehydrogenase
MRQRRENMRFSNFTIVSYVAQVTIAALLLACLGTTCAAEDLPAKPVPGVSPPYRGELPSLAALNVRNAKIDEVVSGLHLPRAFEFLSADSILVTEIHGDLLTIEISSGNRHVVQGLPAIATTHDQTGLMDVALHPDFDANHRIYFSYVQTDTVTGKYFTTVVSTAELHGARLEQLETILRVEPFGWSPANFGGALAFDNAGNLYISIGDRSEDPVAQRGDRLEGKILRLRDDGTVPPDNPFVNDPAVDDRIYAIGVRNAQGLYFDSVSGNLFEAEHGPLGGDEINLILPGANYGWPTITYGHNYSTAPMGEGTHREGMQQPIFYYLPSEAISPLTMYRGSMFPEWEGHLLVGALKGKHVSKLDIDGVTARSEYQMLGELDSRVRDVKVHEDGSIWLLLQNGSLYRLHRTEPETVQSNPGAPGRVYELVCAGCHDTGANGASDSQQYTRHLSWSSSGFWCDE